MTTTSQVEICSNALILIGDKPLANLNEDRDGAVVAKNLYETTVRSLLTSHRWRFAIKKASLSQLTTTPVNEWTYQYQLPTDHISTIRTYPSSSYEIFEDKLLSNNTSVELDYIFRINENYFPPYFTEALEYLMASKMCVPVTGEGARAKAYFSMYLDKLSQARSTDSMGRPNTGVYSSPFTEVRYGN